jgi:hypothetical protein
VNISPTSIDSVEEFGTPIIQSNGIIVSPTSIDSVEAFGVPNIQSGEILILPTSIDSSEEFGTPIIQSNGIIVLPQSINSEEAFGQPELVGGNVYIYPQSVSSEEAFGVPNIQSGEILILPTSIDSVEAFGTPEISAEDTSLLYPDSISSEEYFGIPVISTTITNILPASIDSTEAFGTPKIGRGYDRNNPDIVYNDFLVNMGRGIIDILNDTIGITLHTSAYFPDVNDRYEDITNELPTGNGYIQGGIVLSGANIYATPTNVIVDIAENPRWLATGGNIEANYAVIWDRTTSPNIPIYCVSLGSNALATDGTYFMITFDSDGLFTMNNMLL